MSLLDVLLLFHDKSPLAGASHETLFGVCIGCLIAVIVAKVKVLYAKAKALVLQLVAKVKAFLSR